LLFVLSELPKSVQPDTMAVLVHRVTHWGGERGAFCSMCCSTKKGHKAAASVVPWVQIMIFVTCKSSSTLSSSHKCCSF